MNYTRDQVDLTDIHSKFRPTAEYTFFSSTHRTYSKIDGMFGYKMSLSKIKKIEILLSIFSDHNRMKLEINEERKLRSSCRGLAVNESDYHP